MSENPIMFPVSAGLLDKKHVAQMPGQSLFIFLWFVNRITKDSPNGDGKYSGAVLGGQPIMLSRIAEELGLTYHTVRRYVQQLTRAGYLESQKTGSGFCIYVVRNSHKWCWQRNVRTASKTAPTAESVDPRHATTRSLIQESFQAKFSVTCPWDGSEARALGTLLKGNPSWTPAQLAQMIQNRFSSDGITGDRPRSWLANLAKYHAAPLDRFQKAKAVAPPVKVGQGAEANFKKLLEASQ